MQTLRVRLSWMLVSVAAVCLTGGCKTSRGGVVAGGPSELGSAVPEGRLAFIGCRQTEADCQQACDEQTSWVKPDSEYCRAEGMLEGPLECYCRVAAGKASSDAEGAAEP